MWCKRSREIQTENVPTPTVTIWKPWPGRNERFSPVYGRGST